MSVDHFVLTRFNLPTGGVEARIRAGNAWLTHRWELFERYSVPSMLGQTQHDHTWVVYFDPESPAWLFEAVAGYAERGVFVPIYRDEVTTEALVSDLEAITGTRSTMLLTTNLDNDDALANDALARLRSAVDSTERHALFMVNGLIKGPSGVYARRDPDNAFCSVAEPWERARTCWDEWHLMLGRSMPVVRLPGAPGWLQVVHGENVSNRVRGRLVDPRRESTPFPGLLDDVPSPGVGRRWADRVVLGPLRWVRDTVRATGRRVLLTLVGKDGLHRVRGWMAVVVRRSA